MKESSRKGKHARQCAHAKLEASTSTSQKPCLLSHNRPDCNNFVAQCMLQLFQLPKIACATCMITKALHIQSHHSHSSMKAAVHVVMRLTLPLMHLLMTYAMLTGLHIGALLELPVAMSESAVAAYSVTPHLHDVILSS